MSGMPHRRFELTLKVSADDWEGAVHEVEVIARHLEGHGSNCTSVSGSPSTGHIVTIVERPEMTHEKYAEQLDVYVEQQRAKRLEQKTGENQ